MRTAVDEPTKEMVATAERLVTTHWQELGIPWALTDRARLVRAVAHAIAEAVATEREACAKFVDDVARDWKAAGAWQKVYAAEYLSRGIHARTGEGGEQ